MTDLVEFLRDRLDDTARKAHAANGTRWLAAQGDDELTSWVMNEDMHLFETDPPTSAHIAEHDPARVLADVDAKRRIIAECERTLAYEDHGHWLANQTLATLALPFREHPDYRPDWAPDGG